LLANPQAIRKALARWYDQNHRDLPWRRTRDPYAIWISEIMLQQTRVAAASPYYEKFMARFPDAAALASAAEEDVLTGWAGLGYYSRARNLQKAARQIVERGGFPPDYESILELPGVGTYTAAAIASIAFGLPYAVVDGNVRRVIARLTNSNETNAQSEADRLMERRNPARSNQALMELGAVICVPRDPRCEACPVRANCEAFRHGTQGELPRKSKKLVKLFLDKSLMMIQKRGKLLLAPSERVAGFWDLPETFEGTEVIHKIGTFRHSITNKNYVFHVFEASAETHPKGFRWFGREELHEIPLSTTAKKGLRCLQR
jgi:A/G-specific adenine glycosylase